jgi:hypothetical protein
MRFLARRPAKAGSTDSRSAAISSSTQSAEGAAADGAGDGKSRCWLRDRLRTGVRPKRLTEIVVRRLNGTILIDGLDITTVLTFPFEDRFNLRAHAAEDREEMLQPILLSPRIGLKRADPRAGGLLCLLQFLLGFCIGCRA